MMDKQHANVSTLESAQVKRNATIVAALNNIEEEAPVLVNNNDNEPLSI